MAFPRVQFSKIFPGEHAPGPPYIIRGIGADSLFVSPVTWCLTFSYKKNLAESSALLNKTLATGLQSMFSAMQRPGNICYQSSNPPGFTANNCFNQSQFSPFYPNRHMSATREHTEQHNFNFDGYTHGEYNE